MSLPINHLPYFDLQNNETNLTFNMSSIELLPEEVLLDIFGNLDVKDLGYCAQACKKFRKEKQDN